MDERAARRRRLRMRSWRRGTREMDLILGPYADATLGTMEGAGLDAFENLLACDDQDLYLWVGRRAASPPEHEDLIVLIQRFHGLC